MIRTLSLATFALGLSASFAGAQIAPPAGGSAPATGSTAPRTTQQPQTSAPGRPAGSTNADPNQNQIQNQNQNNVTEGGVNDALFAQVAAGGGLAEISLSQIGLQKASDPELRRFSQKMIDEHSQLNQELVTLASQKRLALPRMLDVKAQFCAQALNGASRENFDRCYAKAQTVAHMEALAAFEAEAERGQDPEVRAWARRAVPKIKAHLREIKPICMKYEKDEKDDSRADDDRKSDDDKKSSDKKSDDDKKSEDK